MRTTLLLWMILCVWGFGASAAGVGRDTLDLRVEGDTVPPAERAEKKPHSPHRATIMAMVLPGSGQIYNGQWWKVPILYGGVAADIYGITWNQKRYREYRDAYIEWVQYTEALAKNPDTPYPDNPAWDKIPKNFDLQSERFQNDSMRKWFADVLNNRKRNFKRNRDLCYIIMAAIYAVNIIDATVYAHFYDFEIDDDLSLHVRPTSSYSPLNGGMVGLTLTLNF